VTTAALGNGFAVVLADEKGKGSPIGIFVVLLLCVAVYFLYRSMSRHLRKVPPSFEPPDDDRPSPKPPAS
jgi:hypothetical protein